MARGRRDCPGDRLPTGSGRDRPGTGRSADRRQRQAATGLRPGRGPEPGFNPRNASEVPAERCGCSGRPARSRGREREVQSGAFVGVGLPACPGVLRAAWQGQRASGHCGASAGLRSGTPGAAGRSAGRVRPASREAWRPRPKPTSRPQTGKPRKALQPSDDCHCRRRRARDSGSDRRLRAPALFQPDERADGSCRAEAGRHDFQWAQQDGVG